MTTTQYRNGGGQQSRRSQQHNRLQRPPHNKRPSSHSLSRSGGRNALHKADEDLDDEMIGGGFLQYCTYCEKQLVVPAVSVLYCSESCRRKDHSKTLSHASDEMSEAVSPLRTFSSTSLHDLPSRDIIPQRSPTAMNMHRFSTYSASSDHLSEDEQYSEDDLHPRQSSTHYHNSEAARYLRQFRHPGSLDEPSSRTPRPRYNRSSGSITGLGLSTAAPSLSHSPTSTEAMSSLPYTPSTRPLPPRTNPFSTSSYSSRSVDLVNPYVYHPAGTAPSSLASYGLKSHAISQTSMGVLAEGELLYEKTAICRSPPAGTPGSLKQLFKFSDMQAGPGVSHVGRH